MTGKWNQIEDSCVCEERGEEMSRPSLTIFIYMAAAEYLRLAEGGFFLLSSSVRSIYSLHDEL